MSGDKITKCELKERKASKMTRKYKHNIAPRMLAALMLFITSFGKY